jgi:hypothetical protein
VPLDPPPFSPVILLTLLVVAAASSVTFWLLVRRATSHRQWVALSDWARETGFRFARKPPNQIPSPLDALRNVAPVVRLSLFKGPISFVQIEVPEPQSAGPPAGGRRVLWNVLIRQIEPTWPPTGLRPTNATASVLDLFSLSGFPNLGSTERFIAYGTDPAAARVLSKSSARSLLPADIGLLLHGCTVVLDFSDRPFDVIEFGRMLALSDQLATRLPAPP